jgi:glycosyltransferase involved in cell wall biosynthesis
VDGVVQPTLQEAFSQVMAESLWMSKPLVITDVSGAPDIIQEGETGLLVPKADVAALVQAIQRLAGDPGFGRRLGESGRAYVEEHLTIEKIIHRYEQTYCRAMEA